MLGTYLHAGIQTTADSSIASPPSQSRRKHRSTEGRPDGRFMVTIGGRWGPSRNANLAVLCHSAGSRRECVPRDERSLPAGVGAILEKRGTTIVRNVASDRVGLTPGIS